MLAKTLNPSFNIFGIYNFDILVYMKTHHNIYFLKIIFINKLYVWVINDESFKSN